MNNLEIESILNLPTTAFTRRSLYSISERYTWCGISKSNYPNYDTDEMVYFLITINDSPNSDLPLGEIVFFLVYKNSNY